MIKHIKLLIAFSTVLFLTSNIFAATLFSGYAGGKITYSANDEAAKYDPDLKLQAFFAGQFNFSPDLWSHLEFSVDTKDFVILFGKDNNGYDWIDWTTSDYGCKLFEKIGEAK